MFKPVREVAFSRLANEGAHRGEILRGASLVALFQNDPAEFFVSHNCAHGYKPLVDNALSRRRLSIESPGEAHAADRQRLCVISTRDAILFLQHPDQRIERAPALDSLVNWPCL